MSDMTSSSDNNHDPWTEKFIVTFNDFNKRGVHAQAISAGHRDPFGNLLLLDDVDNKLKEVIDIQLIEDNNNSSSSRRKRRPQQNDNDNNQADNQSNSSRNRAVQARA